MSRGAGREAGVALVLVLWVSVLLTVVASSFIVERRTGAEQVRPSTAKPGSFGATFTKTWMQRLAALDKLFAP